MLDREQVIALMKEMESDRIERTLSDREDKLGPAVCYLANDIDNTGKPGYILFGVNDDGSPAGLKITDAIIQNLGNIRANGNVQPFPSITVSPVFHFEEGDVAVITVQASDFPPVRHKGTIWIRIGNRKQIAGEQDEKRLLEKRNAFSRNFDEHPCLNANSEDLARDSFYLNYLPTAIDRETLERNNRTFPEQLASVGFWDNKGNCPTYGGIIIIGLDPVHFLKGAYVQYVKLGGDSLDGSEVVLEKQFSGPLVTMLKSLNDFVSNSVVNKKPVRGNGFQEDTLYNYPLWALRELLMNAVMHRDYDSNAPIYFYEFSDRIEIQNPGGLYGDVTPENFPRASDYRNPIVAAGMKNLGFVNRFNFGVKNAQYELEKNGNPPAEFDLSLRTKFLVKIFKHPQWLAKH